MRTKIITSLKKELLLVELPENGYYEEYRDGIEVRDFLTDEVLTLTNYTLLGKLDEIREEDAEELVEPFDLSYYVDYNHPSRGAYTITALDSFHSALESEIYWENPEPKLSDFEYFLPSINEGVKFQKKFDEAEEKTFDKNRTLIFAKL